MRKWRAVSLLAVIFALTVCAAASAWGQGAHHGDQGKSPISRPPGGTPHGTPRNAPPAAKETPGEGVPKAPARAARPNAPMPALIVARVISGDEPEPGYLPGARDFGALPVRVVDAQSLNLGDKIWKALAGGEPGGLLDAAARRHPTGFAVVLEVTKHDVARTAFFGGDMVRSTAGVRLRAWRLEDKALLAEVNAPVAPGITDHLLRSRVQRFRGLLARALEAEAAGPARMRIAWRAPSARVARSLAQRVRRHLSPLAQTASVVHLQGWTVLCLEPREGIDEAKVAATLKSLAYLKPEPPRGEVLVLSYVKTRDPRGELLADETPPALRVDAPRSGAWIRGRRVTVRGVVDDKSVREVRIGSVAAAVKSVAAAVKNGAFSAEIEIASGENHVQVSAKDAAGNRAQQELLLYCDDAPPVLRVAAPAPNAVLTENQTTVSGTVTDENGVTLTVSGKPCEVKDGAFSANVPLLPARSNHGMNAIELLAVDPAGNSAKTVLRVAYDTRPPIVSVPGEYNGAHVNRTPFRFPVLVTDDGPPGSFTSATVNGALFDVSGKFSTKSASVPLKEGDNTVTVRVVDRAGREASDVFHVVLDTVKPVLGDIRPDENQSVGDEEFTLRFAARDRNIQAVSVTMDGRDTYKLPVRPDGKYVFKYTIPDFQRRRLFGVLRVNIEARDRAGNTASVDLWYWIKPPPK